MIANENEPPITPEFRALMNALAAGTDRILNGDPPPPPRRWKKKNGFVLLAFEFGRVELVNYISNAERSDMVTALKSFLARVNPIDETDVLLAMARAHDAKHDPSSMIWSTIDASPELTEADKIFVTGRIDAMKAALAAARKAGL